MSIYTVTFCMMDPQAGANPFWHTCLLLSVFDEKTKKLEVVENWGFYGVPTTSKNTILRRVKIKLGLDVDLTGNHGILKHEETRYLDLGCGLHGKTFELTAEKFNALAKKCEDIDKQQKQAITEIAEQLKLSPKTEKPRIYPYENFSRIIYTLEQERAKKEGRPSWLQPFNLNIINTKEVNTCKTQALHILDGILSPEQIKSLRGIHPGVSRFSGEREKIFLHSSGDMREHVKRSGEVTHFRDKSTSENVKLYWTIPPQEVEFISANTANLFKISPEYIKDVKKTISQLQQLEWVFINQKLDADLVPYQNDFLKNIRDHYEAFSIIEAKDMTNAKTGLTGQWYWLFNLPRDKAEQSLMSHLADAKQLINYFRFVWADKKLFEPEAAANDPDVLALYLSSSKQRIADQIVDPSFLKQMIYALKTYSRFILPAKLLGPKEVENEASVLALHPSPTKVLKNC